MNRISGLAVVAFLATTQFASAQNGPSPLAAPVGHRQPTASGLAPVASPDAVEPTLSGRSVHRGSNFENRDNLTSGNVEQGPRICTNCDD